MFYETARDVPPPPPPAKKAVLKTVVRFCFLEHRLLFNIKSQLKLMVSTPVKSHLSLI